MHATIRLGDGYTLNAMHTRLVLQCAIDISSRYGEVDFLETADGTFVEVGDGELPALRLAKTFVHLEQVAGEETSFVATRSGADFHLHVLGVLRIFRHESNLDFLFKLGL